MLASSLQQRFPGPTPSAAIHQLYITHCLYDEGIFRQAGFAPRASSTLDPLQLRFAQEYPPYELPGGWASDDEALSSAPRRLALVRLPGGPKALIHSAPLSPEHHGRANDFFSHVLISPALTPREALQRWASSGWVTWCDSDEDKELPPLSALPEPGPLDDRALTAFLRNEQDAGADTPPFPARLLADGPRRRELLSLTLRACLLIFGAAPGTTPNRLFILAEPELAALLLFATVRLLPPHLTAEMTFSTYEPVRHVPRGTCNAQIIALMPGPGDQELSEEFFQSRGYFLDTFRPRCSDELRQKEDPALQEWIDLAEKGEWQILDKVYALLGNTGSGIVSFQQGLQAARLAHRLTNGKAESADLLALKRSAWGPALLEQHGEKIWPLVREASERDPRVSEAFADLLALHIPDLEQELAEAFRLPSGEWQRSCRQLLIALRGDLGRLRDIFQRVLPPPPYSTETRFSILRELHELQLFPVKQPFPLHTLLRQCSADELEQFARSSLPREWFAWALCYSIVRSETRGDAARHLLGGDDTLLGIFWEQFKFLKGESQRRAILGPLLSIRDERAVLFFGRSLKVLPSLRLETLQWMLETLGALTPEWHEFWCSGDHLARLLELLRNLGDDAQKLWDSLHANIEPERLLLGDSAQRTFVLNLAAARDRPGLPLPGWAVQTVTDWVLLYEHFEKASAVPESERGTIVAACKRRGVDAIGMLRRYFERYVMPQEITPHLLDDFAGFFESFYLPGSDYQDAGTRFLGWIDVVRACPDASRQQTYRQYYLENRIGPEFRDRLAEEVLSEKRLQPPPSAAALSPVVLVQSESDAGKTDEAFLLAGVRSTNSPLAALCLGAPWLLCGLAGGVLAVTLFSVITLPPRHVLLFCSYLPLVLVLSDSAVLQQLAIGRTVRGRRGLLTFLASGAAVALAGGVLAAGIGLLFALPSSAIFSISGAVCAGMLVSSVLGLSVPALLSRWHLDMRIPAGPIARMLTGAVTLALYLGLAGRLLR